MTIGAVRSLQHPLQDPRLQTGGGSSKEGRSTLFKVAAVFAAVITLWTFATKGFVAGCVVGFGCAVVLLIFSNSRVSNVFSVRVSSHPSHRSWLWTVLDWGSLWSRERVGSGRGGHVPVGRGHDQGRGGHVPVGSGQTGGRGANTGGNHVPVGRPTGGDPPRGGGTTGGGHVPVGRK